MNTEAKLGFATLPPTKASKQIEQVQLIFEGATVQQKLLNEQLNRNLIDSVKDCKLLQKCNTYELP